jgi:hypothetical protein
MSILTDAWRITGRTVLLVLSVATLAMPQAVAQESAATLRAVPSALLSIDQNRSTVVDRIVADWGDDLAKSKAGITVEQLRSTLLGMRSDYLLAASIAGSLEGLRNVIASSLIGAAPVKHMTTKALGDTADDLAYTPVTPCRILDTRTGGGVLLAGQTRSWLAANPAGTFATQGGASTNCGIPIKPAAVLANVTVFDTTGGPAFLVAWPFNQARPLASTLNWTTVAQQLANAFILPLCTGVGCTSDFSTFASAQTGMLIDVMGYFAAPVGTAVQCTEVASANTTIPVTSDTAVALPSCATGSTRTGAKCSGTANVPGGYLVEINATGCVFRNLSAVATYSANAISTCCQVPGR